MSSDFRSLSSRFFPIHFAVEHSRTDNVTADLHETAVLFINIRVEYDPDTMNQET